jgi:hypothetical protein
MAMRSLRRKERSVLILTADGKRSIDNALVLCIDEHRRQGEYAYVTVYLLTGEHVKGTVEQADLDDLDPPPMTA